jgi:hypothetical protein
MKIFCYNGYELHTIQSQSDNDILFIEESQLATVLGEILMFDILEHLSDEHIITYIPRKKYYKINKISFDTTSKHCRAYTDENISKDVHKKSEKKFIISKSDDKVIDRKAHKDSNIDKLVSKITHTHIYTPIPISTPIYSSICDSENKRYIFIQPIPTGLEVHETDDINIIQGQRELIYITDIYNLYNNILIISSVFHLFRISKKSGFNIIYLPGITVDKFHESYKYIEILLE